MKTKTNIRNRLSAAILFTSLAAGSAFAGESQSKIMVVSDGEVEEGLGTSAVAPKQVIVRTLAGGGDKHEAAASVWLGVGVEEGTEALAAQLSLPPGEGLVVNYVTPGSPATIAGLKENDVLVELDGQILVDASQFRKLIRMHAEGDTIKIAYFRAGKKQTTSAKLAKNRVKEFSFAGDTQTDGNGNFKLLVRDLPDGDRGDLNIQIKKAMEGAQLAIDEAMKQPQDGQNPDRKMEIITQKLGKLASGGVTLDKDATVVVKSDTETVRTIVKTDETGTYVILADPRQHLTVTDKDGKLLFDGAIETPEEQKQVPAEIWKKAQPILEQLNPKTGGKEKQ